MKGSFQINKTNKGVIILGLEFDDYQYTVNFVRYALSYLFEDTVTYNIVYKVNVSVDSQTEELFEFSEFVEHNSPENHNEIHRHDVSSFKFSKDGLYRVVHIIIPTFGWLVKYVQTFGKNALFDVYKTVYYTDGSYFYKYTSEGQYEVEPLELVEVNTEGTTICRSDQFTFCTDRLDYCFYKLACALLDKICPLDECADEEDEAWYQLHLIQIERYVILFLLELGRYLEAEQLLNALSGCAGPCYSILNGGSTMFNFIKTKSNCGCSM